MYILLYFSGCNEVTVYYYDNIDQIEINPSGCLDSSNYNKDVNGNRCPKDIRYQL